MSKEMRLKKKKTNKTEPVNFRCTLEEFQLIQRKALLYTEGNLSEFIVFASTEFVPSKEDFENYRPKKNKG